MCHPFRSAVVGLLLADWSSRRSSNRVWSLRFRIATTKKGLETVLCDARWLPVRVPSHPYLSLSCGEMPYSSTSKARHVAGFRLSNWSWRGFPEPGPGYFPVAVSVPASRRQTRSGREIVNGGVAATTDWKMLLRRRDGKPNDSQLRAMSSSVEQSLQPATPPGGCSLLQRSRILKVQHFPNHTARCVELRHQACRIARGRLRLGIERARDKVVELPPWRSTVKWHDHGLQKLQDQQA